jgi:hypothetical protein
MDPDFIEHIRIYTARYSVSASATRGQRTPGLVDAARGRLARVPLRLFGVASERKFRTALNRETELLRLALPRSARRWGVARKLLNIYLRNALYTSYLQDAYQLGAAEGWYEIPLDAIVAKQLRFEVGGLPRWPGVKHLTPGVSALYQLAARAVAARHGVAPVHLDAKWWGGPRMPAT